LRGTPYAYISSVIRRRILNITPRLAPPGLSTNRRTSFRRELSERIRLSLDEREITGWTLNVSVGGLRAIVEEPLDPGLDVRIALDSGSLRPGRIVWVQREPDGSIVGLCFLEPPTAALPLKDA
jgi:hypothetical protein